ncbi:Phosphopantetheine attachment site, partial [Chitinophaga eiseniae]
DDRLQLCAVGITGEICIGGAGLARGYLGRPELSAEKFVPDPYRAGERLYRTGDLGRWLPDGTIAFAGRRDDQVKVRGYRIELGEIVHALEQHPGISAAVVITQGATAEEKTLVSYFTGDAGLDIATLRAYLDKRLPAYMLPDYYIHLDTLPLNASGKVDRKRLPTPQGAGLATGREYVAPRNTTEEKLVDIWRNVLGRTGIGVKDSFFELGGHSLKATRLESQIYKVFEVKVALHDLFGAPVLENQAALIERSRKTVYNSIMPAPKQSGYPLSSSQRRLWVLSQFAESSVAYNMPGAYVFEGVLAISSLTYAFNELIRRHEILRTVFNEDENGEVKQYILEADESIFNIEYVDLRDIANRKARLQQLVERAAGKAFDLSRGPLLRAGLYQTDDHRWIFAYTMHHIISDGWSMDVLLRELLHIYNVHTAGQPHALQGLSVQYKDYAFWQQCRLTDGSLATAQAYWLKQFEGELPQLLLPLDHSRPAVKTYNGGVVVKLLPASLSGALKLLVKEQGATLFMGLFGLVNVLLHRYTQQEDLIIGTPIAGREHADLSDQIGIYINTLALRTRFSGNENFVSLLKQIRENMLAAYEHQAYPFDELVEQLQLQRDMSRNALFDVMVILQNNERRVLSGDGILNNLHLSAYENHTKEISKLDITFEFEETEEGIVIYLKYNSDLFEAATIHRMAAHLQQLLKAALHTPDMAVNSLPYLTEGEESALLDIFNVKSPGYDTGATIITCFEQQVAQSAERTALVFKDS